MRILLLTEYYPDNEQFTGGVEARTYNLSIRLAKKHDVFVITSWRRGQERQCMVHGVRVLRVGPHHCYSNNAGYLSRLRFSDAAAQEGKRHSVDIVEGCNWTTYLAAKKISAHLKVPCVITYHETWVGQWIRNKGLSGLPYELYERYLLRQNYDKIVSVSHFTKSRLCEAGLDNKDIAVIPNGIDLARIEKIRAKKEPKTVCYVGRLVKTKHVDRVIEACATAKAKLRIIGQGDEMTRLKAFAQKQGLDCHFLGYVERYEDVIKMIKSSSVFCSASEVEGFGIVLLEAMASGTPFVCSDIASFREVSEGKGGIITDSTQEMASAIKRLLEDKKFHEQKVKQARQHILRYNWDSIANDVEHMYSALI